MKVFVTTKSFKVGIGLFIISLLILLITAIRTPIAIPLKMVELYPEYFSFEFNHNDWERDNSGIKSLFLDLLIAKISNDWITQEIKKSEASTIVTTKDHVGERITDIASSINKTILSQRHLDAPPFKITLSKRLLLGWGYCDQINQFLSFVIADIYGMAQAWGTRYPNIGVDKELFGVSTHSLVLTNISGVDVYADAWNYIHVFKFKDENNLLNDVPLYDDMAHDAPQEKFGFQDQARGLLIKNAYLNGWSKTTDYSRLIKSGTIDLKIKPEINYYINKYRNDAEMLFLIGRLYYLYGYYNAAKTFFLKIARSGCEETMPCKLARKNLEYSF